MPYPKYIPSEPRYCCVCGCRIYTRKYDACEKCRKAARVGHWKRAAIGGHKVSGGLKRG